MTSNFADPKNALKRAEEYIRVGDKSSALQTLHSILGNKRHVNKDKESLKTLEKVMLKYLDLCIEMRRGNMAKDGLHQYKYVLKSSKAPPSQHATSLEVAIRHFLTEANQSLLDAQKKNEVVANEEVEDLDEDEEGVVVVGVAAKPEKKSGKTTVVSALKFLWESFRIVLEILRNYPKLESLYADTAKQAFSFCQTYGRKNEFRRLSEILRNHLLGLTKQQQHQQHQPGVVLSNPETAQLLLEVRFAQLNVATGMELWQESFRSVEDIHNLIVQSKRTPPQEMMCLYYERLAQIFWQGKNHLFHAFSCLKYFRLLQKVKQDMTDAQRSAISSQVLLAALSVPVSAANSSDFGFDFDVQQEKNSRIATLLGSSSPISRGEFVADLVNKGILDLVYPEVAQLYKLMENKFSPLTFGSTFSNFLEFLRSRGELKVYADSIAANGFRRLVLQLVPFYQTIKLNRLFGLAKFVSPDEIEALLVQSVTAGIFAARIDHRVGVVHFSSDRLESDHGRFRLSSLSSSLTTTVENFDGYKEQQAARKQKIFDRTVEKLDEEHGSILMRMVLIEKRKEAEEEKNRRMIQEKEELERNKIEEDKKRAEIKEEEKKKAQKEREEKIIKAKRELIESEVAQDKAQNVQVQVQKLKEQKQVMEGRLKKLAKDLDHLERARREEERPLLEALSKELIEKDKKYHQEQSSKILEDLRAAHAKKLQEKKRLMVILPFRGSFEDDLTQKRKQSNESLLEKEKEKRNRLQSRLDVALKGQQALFAQKEALEEQRGKIEEAIRRKHEEEEEKKRREREEKAKADEERAAKLAEQAALQRKREQEILEKQNRPRNQESSGGGGAWKSRRTEARVSEEGGSRPGGDWRSRQSQDRPPVASGGGGGWRERSQQKQQEQQQPKATGTWKSQRQQQQSQGPRQGGEEGGWRTAGEGKRNDWGKSRGSGSTSNAQRW